MNIPHNFNSFFLMNAVCQIWLKFWLQKITEKLFFGMSLMYFCYSDMISHVNDMFLHIIKINFSPFKVFVSSLVEIRTVIQEIPQSDWRTESRSLNQKSIKTKKNVCFSSNTSSIIFVAASKLKKSFVIELNHKSNQKYTGIRCIITNIIAERGGT